MLEMDPCFWGDLRYLLYAGCSADLLSAIALVLSIEDNSAQEIRAYLAAASSQLMDILDEHQWTQRLGGTWIDTDDWTLGLMRNGLATYSFVAQLKEGRLERFTTRKLTARYVHMPSVEGSLEEAQRRALRLLFETLSLDGTVHGHF